MNSFWHLHGVAADYQFQNAKRSRVLISVSKICRVNGNNRQSTKADLARQQTSSPCHHYSHSEPLIYYNNVWFYYESRGCFEVGWKGAWAWRHFVILILIGQFLTFLSSVPLACYCLIWQPRSSTSVRIEQLLQCHSCSGDMAVTQVTSNWCSTVTKLRIHEISDWIWVDCYLCVNEWGPNLSLHIIHRRSQLCCLYFFWFSSNHNITLSKATWLDPIQHATSVPELPCLYK